MSAHDDRDPALSAAFRALARDDERSGASPEVEARLLKEVRAIGAARRQGRYVFLAAAAALIVASVASLQLQWSPAAPAILGGDVASREVATGFMPLVYNSLPASNLQIVRLEVPESALITFGLAVPGAAGLESISNRTVLADVLVGDDGLARAVRFVRPLRQQGVNR